MKENNNMYTVMGVGTTLIGKREVEADGSYIATKWFVFIFFPIIPLGSYRVWRGETTASVVPLISVGATTQYRMIQVPLNRKQIIETYLGIFLAVFGTIVAIMLAVLELSHFQTHYFLIALTCAGFGYAIYLLFKNGEKWWAILLIISAIVLVSVSLV
jgi:hypothetical protein